MVKIDENKGQYDRSKSFVFIVDDDAYKVQEIEGELWVCYWGANNNWINWITKEPISFEIARLYWMRRIPDEQAAIYDRLEKNQAKNNKFW